MRILVFASLIVLTVGCATIKNTPSQVGATTLTNYIVNPTASFPDSVNYTVFTNEETFLRSFTATKGGDGSTVPDFKGQQVVAVVLKPTTDIVELRIQKAEIGDKDLNIYYEKITAPGSTFSHTPSVAATVPKSTSVTRANFYRAGIKEKTVDVAY